MKVEIIFIPVGPSAQPTPHHTLGPPPAILWHYTTRQKLALIEAAGVIEPSTALIEPREKPVVWFSSRATWEPTATKCPMTGKLGQYVTASAQGGLARIAVASSTAPHGFPQLPLMAGTSPATCIGLVLAGLEAGADPDQWFFSVQPVPRALWQSIEVYDFDTDKWHTPTVVTTAGAHSGPHAHPTQNPTQNPVPGTTWSPGHNPNGAQVPPPATQKSILDYLGGAGRSPNSRPDPGRPSLN